LSENYQIMILLIVIIAGQDKVRLE